MNNSPVPPRSTTPWNAIVSMFMALLYGISPIDLIPDIIPLLGWVDDAAVVPILLILAYFQFKRAKSRDARANKVIVMPPQH